MRYTNEDFLRLLTEVEDQGGDQIDDTCHSEEITYEMPKGPDETVLTHGCESDTIFIVAYDPSETVLVPEPILEPDPDREEWADANGDARVTRRSVKEKMQDGTERVVIEIVERPGEIEAIGGIVDRSTVVACAVGDNMGMWPRFRHAMRDERTG